MARRFRVVTTTDQDTGRKTAYGVTDITDAEYEIEQKLAKTRSVNEKFKYNFNEEVRPRVATFVVSQLYGQEEQEALAYALVDYMNKVLDSQAQALQQNSLLEVLTTKAAEYHAKETDDKDEV
jgi:hypothetical protein